MSRLPVCSGAEAVKALRKLGYEVDHQTGSHMILRNPSGRRLTVPTTANSPKAHSAPSSARRVSPRNNSANCCELFEANHDGHLDIVVRTLFKDWSDPKRASLLWIENDGRHHFTPYSIATQPTHPISAAIGDTDGDGRLDIVTCGMYGFPPLDRMGRVTLWKNQRGHR